MFVIALVAIADFVGVECGNLKPIKSLRFLLHTTSIYAALDRVSTAKSKSVGVGHMYQYADGYVALVFRCN